MSDNNLLATWIDQANKRMSDQEKEHDKLRIDFTRLEAQVNTRTKILWALVGLLVAATGIIVTIIKLGNN